MFFFLILVKLLKLLSFWVDVGMFRMIISKVRIMVFVVIVIFLCDVSF